MQNPKFGAVNFSLWPAPDGTCNFQPFHLMAEDRKSPEARQQMTELERIRHSSAHVLATAILRIWPDAQFAAGPPVENGFYYDVELDHHISPGDFEKIEAEMKKVNKELSALLDQETSQVNSSSISFTAFRREKRFRCIGTETLPTCVPGLT